MGQAVPRRGCRGGRRARLGSSWLKLAVEWITQKAPRYFGFLRSRWCREAVAVLMRQIHHVEIGRTWLRKGGRVYRRPRPVLGPTDELPEERLNALRKVLRPDNETAVFQDEVETPGNNQ